LAMLGHELRNPLAPILTAVDLLKVRGAVGMERERAIIERHARHLVRIIDDLLDVSRAASGKILLKKKHVELAEVVATAVEQTRTIMDERRHRLEVNVPQTGLVVEADPARLAQSIGNLLTNAAKYTDPGGRVTLTATPFADRVEIKVSDTGIGIEPEMLDSVFNAFIQERQALDRARGGLGVGLAIVRSLIALHGGTVAAYSEGHGKGTDLIIRLPLPAPSFSTASIDAAPAKTEDRASSEGLRILMVDDNRDAAEMIVEYLASLGHTVRAAHDGESALKKALDFVPEVVLLDIGLPVMDGYEVARRLREHESGKNMRLIALTGYGQETDKRRTKDASFDAHLVKPVSMAELEAAILSRA
jgi:CheY-like chemotaxis protein